MSLAKLNVPVKRPSLVDSVYETLLEAIISGQLSPGTELNSVQLANQLDVSRTPVTEAINLLAHDGVVEQVNHRRARVARFSRQELADIYEVRKLLEAVPGIGAVVDPGDLQLDHPRSGELVALAEPDAWFSYYYWTDDSLAPDFARTVDIHRKPGYDPVELFFDAKTKGIPLDASLVRGSHGVPATEARHRTALICSKASSAVEAGRVYRDADISRISLGLLNLAY